MSETVGAARTDEESSDEPQQAEARVTVAHLTTAASSLRDRLYPQLIAVRDRGADVVGISAPGPEADALAAAGIRHVALPSAPRGLNPFADIRAAWTLRRFLRREKVDVLHTHDPRPGLYGRVIGRRASVPIVVNTNRGISPAGRLARALVMLREAFAARFSDAELVQNPEDLRSLTRWRVNPRQRAALLGSGINLDRFVPDKIDSTKRSAIRDRLGATDGTVVVGVVGRLVQSKGYHELAEAARLLGDRFAVDRYVVVAIGSSELDEAEALTPEDIRAAEDAGIVFLGHREDVDELYGAMDVFAFPSHRESFPRAAMEAAASGVPVVASDVRGCRQVVDHGVTGLLVPFGDPEALADAIAELGEDPDRRTGMGKAAVARAEERFDEKLVVQTVLDTYHEVATRKGLSALAEVFSG